MGLTLDDDNGDLFITIDRTPEGRWVQGEDKMITASDAEMLVGSTKPELYLPQDPETGRRRRSRW